MPASPQKTVELQKQNLATLEKTIQTLSSEAGLTWISATEIFRKAASEGQFVYYETDTHWDTEGRRLAAELVTAQLLGKKASPVPRFLSRSPKTRTPPTIIK